MCTYVEVAKMYMKQKYLMPQYHYTSFGGSFVNKPILILLAKGAYFSENTSFLTIWEIKVTIP